MRSGVLESGKVLAFKGIEYLVLGRQFVHNRMLMRRRGGCEGEKVSCR